MIRTLAYKLVKTSIWLLTGVLVLIIAGGLLSVSALAEKSDKINPADILKSRFGMPADVAADRLNGEALVAQARGDVFAGLRRAVRDQHARAAFGEGAHDRGADAAAAAGDERHLAVQRERVLRHAHRAPANSSNTALWRSTSSAVVPGQHSVMLWKGVISTPRFIR